MGDRFDEIPAQIDELLGILSKQLGRLNGFETDIVPKIGRTSDSVLIPVQILESAYTAIETLFVRVSQAFENHLIADRWHADLLDKMVLEIPGVRPRVIAAETQTRLRELMRFRHFTRYYFELDYDWRKIDLLVLLFREAVPLLERDLGSFASKLKAVLA
jgi:hypothetical protein